jgi:hypothetical protein
MPMDFLLSQRWCRTCGRKTLHGQRILLEPYLGELAFLFIVPVLLAFFLYEVIVLRWRCQVCRPGAGDIPGYPPMQQCKICDGPALGKCDGGGGFYGCGDPFCDKHGGWEQGRWACAKCFNRGRLIIFTTAIGILAPIVAWLLALAFAGDPGLVLESDSPAPALFLIMLSMIFLVFEPSLRRALRLWLIIIPSSAFANYLGLPLAGNFMFIILVAIVLSGVVIWAIREARRPNPWADWPGDE